MKQQVTGQPGTAGDPRTTEGSASYRELFGIGEFRALWTAQALSLFGDQFAQVAIAILVYDRTRSAFLTGVAYSLTILPLIAGGPLLAGLADIFPRRGVMICCDLARVPLAAVMAIPSLPFWALCLLLLSVVLLGAPFSAARSALMPDVLPGGNLALGQAVTTMTIQFSQVAGFVAGASVVAVLRHMAGGAARLR